RAEPTSPRWSTRPRWGTLPIPASAPRSIQAQLTDAGQYDVIVSNASSAMTSHVAVLTVRTPSLRSFSFPRMTDTPNLGYAGVHEMRRHRGANLRAFG